MVYYVRQQQQKSCSKNYLMIATDVTKVQKVQLR